MENGYIVNQDTFSGPLDVLLEMIDKRKLSINDVSLAKVTEDYINYIQRSDISKKEISQFLLIATTLMLIKSMSLLPGLNLTEEEKMSVEELEERLNLYKNFKNISFELKKIFENKKRVFYTTGNTKRIPIFSPHESITIENINSSLSDVLSKLPEEEKILQTKIEKTISIEEMINKLSQKIQKHISMSFSEFSGYNATNIDREAKINIIVSFLAMLELVKQELLYAHQEETFSDITIKNTKIN